MTSHINSTLQLVAIQHELGMAIGLELCLKPMLQQFTKICISRLGLTGVHFYLSQSKCGEAALPSGQAGITIRHFMSVPDCDKSVIASDVIDSLSAKPDGHEDCLTLAGQKHCEYRYCFKLEQLGSIVLRRRNSPIDKRILEMLKSIFPRLAVGCQSCIEHEHLLQAIEARKKAEETIVFKLFHDELTQLPNRRMLIDTLTQELSRSRRHDLCGAVLYLDLDRFKAVNDTLGHRIGDQLLITVAKTLTDMVRREDTVARLSSDEFAILLTSLHKDSPDTTECIHRTLEKIQLAFTQPLKAGEHILHITPSIGVAIYNRDDDADMVLRKADMAMYHAKQQGPNRSSIYEPQMASELQSRLTVEKELQAAVKTMEQFQLFYQPQFLADGSCIGAEALIRWQLPDLSFVSPAHFIPVAEETGLIIDIGEWVLEQASRHLYLLNNKGLPESFSSLSVNVSALQFNQKNFISKLLNTLNQASIDPGFLDIELTESALISNVDDCVSKMLALQEHGIHLSVDDFGTGYSSLSYLSRFPIETLKIDQSFVRDVHRNPANHAIVRTIMALGQSFNLSVIAEGVETATELACLNELGCERYQGYYFGRPMPFEQLQALLAGQLA